MYLERTDLGLIPCFNFSPRINWSGVDFMLQLCTCNQLIWSAGTVLYWRHPPLMESRKGISPCSWQAFLLVPELIETCHLSGACVRWQGGRNIQWEDHRSSGRQGGLLSLCSCRNVSCFPRSAFLCWIHHHLSMRKKTYMLTRLACVVSFSRI